jgi:hypothetical protein
VAAAEPGLVRIDVKIGKSPLIEVKEPFDRVSVTDPKIADVFVISPNQILISGKTVGVTSLVLFYPRKTVFFDLVVQNDLALLRERLKQIAPRDQIPSAQFHHPPGHGIQRGADPCRRRARRGIQLERQSRQPLKLEGRQAAAGPAPDPDGGGGAPGP